MSVFADLEVTETKQLQHSCRKDKKKTRKTPNKQGGSGRDGPASPVTHLSDGGAELALEHLFQGLELVSGDVA